MAGIDGIRSGLAVNQLSCDGSALDETFQAEKLPPPPVKFFTKISDGSIFEYPSKSDWTSWIAASGVFSRYPGE